VLERWQQRAKELEHEVYALYFASRDARVPWYPKALVVGIVAYAFSLIDLIQTRLLGRTRSDPARGDRCSGDGPATVMAECRKRAASAASWSQLQPLHALPLTRCTS
jgi:hypothetical protein